MCVPGLVVSFWRRGVEKRDLGGLFFFSGGRRGLRQTDREPVWRPNPTWREGGSDLGPV